MDDTNAASAPGRNRRAVGVAAVLIGAALLTTACGGSRPAAGTATDGNPLHAALAFARCMRSHGAPHYPDPNSSGVFIMTSRNAPGFKGQGAGMACGYLGRLMPRGGKPELGPAMQAQADRAHLAFARCMRRHGVIKFPDSRGGGINVGRMQSLGINTNSPQFGAALTACGF